MSTTEAIDGHSVDPDSWRLLHVQGPDDTRGHAVRADGLVNTEDGIPAPGQTVGYEFAFRNPQNERDQTGQLEHLGRYKRVKSLLRNAGRTTVFDPTSDGTTHFREQHSGPSQVVAVRPPAGTSTSRSVWGLVTGGEKVAESLPSVVAIITLEITYLADYEAFADKQSLLRALSNSGW